MDHEKIRKLRRSLDITQDQAAERAGLGTRQNWSSIESGQRTDIRVSTLIAIAKVLNCQPGELIKID